MPVILGGDHTIALPDVTGVARHVGWGRVSVIHFDAHADTGDTQFGSLYGHGTPMRRLIESGAVRGDRFLQIGLRGYWPEPETLAWMAEPADAQLRDDRGGGAGPRRLPDRGDRASPPTTATGCSCRSTSTWSIPGMAPGHRHAGAGRADRPPAARRGPPDRHGAAGGRAWTWSRCRRPTTTPRSPPILANRVVLEALSGIAWRRAAAEAGSRCGSPTTRCSDRPRPRRLRACPRTLAAHPLCTAGRAPASRHRTWADRRGYSQ